MRKILFFSITVMLMLLCLAGTSVAVEKELVLSEAEDAINQARNLFPEIIQGKEYELEVDFRDDRYDGKKLWDIGWRSNHGLDDKYLSIDLDAQSGKLYGFRFRPGKEIPNGNMQVLTREKAKKIAQAFIRKYHPDKLDRITENKKNTGFYRSGNDLDLEYFFGWHEEINNLPVNSNSISVDVNALTGKVSNFYCRWQDSLDLPDRKEMDVETFTSKLIDNFEFYPCYIVDPSTKRSDLPDARLVYKLNTNIRQFNALTGKAVNYQGDEYDMGEVKEFNHSFTPISAPVRETGYVQPRERINPTELQKIAEDSFKKLGHNGRVERSGGGSSVSSNGYREEYWNYRLIPDKDNYQRDYVRVSININTGEIQRYTNRIETVQRDLQSKEIGREKGLEIATDFIKQISPGILDDELVLEQESSYYMGRDESTYDFNWVPLVNGIPSVDSYRVAVDRFSGVVERFDSSYQPVKSIESTQDILALPEVIEIFKESKPIELSYNYMGNHEKNTGKTMLVYSIEYGQGIDAHTGEIIKFGLDNTSTYDTKLQSHWARIPLTLLADSGFLPVPEKFDPNGTVSRREGLRVLGVACNRYHSDVVKSPFEDIADNDGDLQLIMRAVDAKVIEAGGKLRPDEPLTREDLAIWMVNALGHQEVAEASLSIGLDFKDSSSIIMGKHNYVAIAAGLNLIGGDESGNFRPHDAVSWGELASAVVRIAPRLGN